MHGRKFGGRPVAKSVARPVEDTIGGVCVMRPVDSHERYEVSDISGLPVLAPRLAQRDGEWAPPQFLSAVSAVAWMRQKVAAKIEARITGRDAARFWSVARGEDRTAHVAALRLVRAGIDLNAPAIVRVVADMGGWADVCNTPG